MINMATIHEPVMLKEVLEALKPEPGKNYLDGTFGGGGHSLELMDRIKPEGKVIGVDLDPKVAKDSISDNLILVNDNYKNLKEIYLRLKKDGIMDKIDGVLLDLGLSSDQLADSGRGFSFNDQGYLDLRFNPQSGDLTAAEILTSYNQKELFEIFKEFGDDPLAWPLAKEIIKLREQGEKIETAEMLVQLVSRVYKRRYKKPSRKNPATKVFQALRIAVNDEFGNIRKAIPEAVEVLSSGGRLAIITFHSGEDRIVKHMFREMAKAEDSRVKLITKKPIYPSSEEIESNPRSRSAKLRVIEKI